MSNQIKPKRTHFLQKDFPGVETLQVDASQQDVKEAGDHDDEGKGDTETV